jgi:hypothetical protein
MLFVALHETKNNRRNRLRHFKINRYIECKKKNIIKTKQTDIYLIVINKYKIEIC